MSLQDELRAAAQESEDYSLLTRAADAFDRAELARTEARENEGETAKPAVAGLEVMGDAPNSNDLDEYRDHMEDFGVPEEHREEREAGFVEGWTRAYGVATSPAEWYGATDD